MQKSLSIIIPAYNEERYLSACLDAIAAQTVMPDEVIVVDNNSSDRTVEVAVRYSFVTIVKAKRQGIVHARDAGFNAATSDIIGRIDADTLLENNWVEQTKEFFAANPDCDAVTGKCYFYDVPLKRLMSAGQAVVYHGVQRMVAGTQILWGSNMALRRTAWQKLRNHQDFYDNTDEDIVLSLRMADLGMKICRNSKMLAGVSMRRGQLDPLEFHQYLATWPRNYAVTGRHAQKIGIYMLMPGSWIGGVSAGVISRTVASKTSRNALRNLTAALKR